MNDTAFKSEPEKYYLSSALQQFFVLNLLGLNTDEMKYYLQFLLYSTRLVLDLRTCLIINNVVVIRAEAAAYGNEANEVCPL